MKNNLRYIIPLAGLAMLAPSLNAGETDEVKKIIKQEKRIMVMPSAGKGPMPERQLKFIQKIPHGDRTLGFIKEGPPEMETVTFLGVQTEPLGSTLSTQLGVAKGTGLVVVSVVPESAAMGVLQEHDILLKFNDQVLVNMEQLSVLVRGNKKGDKVKLTYLRAGKENKASVTLGEHEVPKRMSMHFNHRLGPDFAPVMELYGKELGLVEEGKNDADQLLWMMDLGKKGGRETVIDAEMDDDRRISISVNTGNGKVELNDDEGSLELIKKDGKKELIAKDAKGEVIFTGPINTPDERAALAPELLQRLEKIEGMREFQFRTDEDFKGGETKVIRMRRGAKLEQPKLPTGLRRLYT